MRVYKQNMKKSAERTYANTTNPTKDSVQGVVALGVHFATLCQEVDFYEANIFFFIINFQKETANTFTLLIILIVKIELHSTNLLL
jgi:hypothetical protein